MISFNLLVFVSIAYVVFLFLIAFAAERRAAQGRTAWLRSSAIYTLSLSIYCTAWTFYGAVGYAARSGLEFLTIIWVQHECVLIGFYRTPRVVQLVIEIPKLGEGLHVIGP